jgi:hypothetical protein
MLRTGIVIHKTLTKFKKSLILPILMKTAAMRQRIALSLLALLLIGFSACKPREKCPAYGQKTGSSKSVQPA